MPKVSVVMAVYNGDSYLKEAIDSILQQTHQDFEFVIINDGSTDQTAEIVNSYSDKRMNIVPQSNHGLAAALNRGITIASGEYIARLDADDIAAPNRLEYQTHCLDDNPDYILVGGYMEFIRADGAPIYVQTVPCSSNEIRVSIENGGNPFLHPSIMFRRRNFIQCGQYNPELRSGQDRDLYKRLVKIGKMANLPVCLGKYRITPGAVSNQTRKTLRERENILRRAERSYLSGADQEYLKKATLDMGRERNLSLYALRVARAYLQHTDDVKSARKYLWESLEKSPYNWPAWYNLFLACLPKTLRDNINRFRGRLIK